MLSREGNVADTWRSGKNDFNCIIPANVFGATDVELLSDPGFLKKTRRYLKTSEDF